MFDHHWKRKRAQRLNTILRGEVQITRIGDRLHLVCPFDAHLVGTLKRLGGWWRHRSGVWSLPLTSQNDLRNTLKAHFTPAQLPEGWR